MRDRHPSEHAADASERGADRHPDRAAGGDRFTVVGRYGARAALLGLTVVLVGIPFGLLLHQVATEGPATGLDDDLARSLNARLHDQGAALTVLEGVSFLGKPITLAVVMVAAVLWGWRRGARRLALFLTVTGVGAGIVNTSLKVLVGRARPEVEVPVHEAFGLSFPSGHAMFSTACYGALLVAFLPVVPEAWRALVRGATVVLVALIGVTRVTLGVHFLTDVLGGHVLGLAWLLASVAAFEAWRSDQWLARSHPLEEGVDPEEASRLKVRPAEPRSPRSPRSATGG